MVERLASYDYRELGKVLRPKLEADGRGWRKVSEEIGVTPPDLSRICSGQPVSASKVFAVCEWLGVAARAFFTRGSKAAESFTADALKHGELSVIAEQIGSATTPQEVGRIVLQLPDAVLLRDGHVIGNFCKDGGFEAATDLVALRLRALYAVRDEKGRLPPDCTDAIERQLSILHFVTNGEVTARV